MAGLYVVVAEGLGIVLHIVNHLGGNVGPVSSDEVGEVAGGLSLQDVAIVK